MGRGTITGLVQVDLGVFGGEGGSAATVAGSRAALAPKPSRGIGLAATLLVRDGTMARNFGGVTREAQEKLPAPPFPLLVDDRRFGRKGAVLGPAVGAATGTSDLRFPH
jgi:hypothetical protein